MRSNGAPKVMKRPTATRRGEQSAASVEGGFVLGRAAFDKLNALEGIVPDADALKRETAWDAAGLSSDERRRRIIEAYRSEG